MSPPNPVAAPRKYFSIEDANRSLPLVKAIVADIVDQFRRVDDLRRRLSALSTRTGRRQDPAPADPYAEELAQSQAELDTEEVKLREYIEELERLGVELKGADGLCDFPSLRDGRPVYLCWRLGEPEVLYWHELQTGFAGRQPLKPLAAAARPK